MKFILDVCFTGTLLASSLPDFPIVFEENRGHIKSSARFVSHGRGFRLELQSEGWNIIAPSSQALQTVTARLLGSRHAVPIEGVQPLRGKTSYFLGNDSSTWRNGINNMDACVVSQEVPSGAAPITVVVGGISSPPGVTIAVQ